jgi:hypothetical protein
MDLVFPVVCRYSLHSNFTTQGGVACLERGLLYENDKINAQGTYTFTDGSEYKGSWKDNKPHGSGVETFNDGSRKVGFWVEGTYVGTEKPEVFE